MKRVAQGAMALFVSTLTLGCSKPSPAAATAGTTVATAADLSFCVAETNRYRAAVNRPPLEGSSALEAQAALAAAADAASGRAHGYFVDSHYGNGLVAGENEFLSPTAPLQTLIHQGLALFWSEGPSGGHYQNIVNSAYTQIGCGFTSVNSTTVIVQDFR